ncbi:hypothetical protein, partial [Bacillus sp. AFS015896]|uniref:hypothetical protein n=1 Tax=Bacillus sp. AFS015896 TaxID=2033487 RepID=UPI001C54CB9F
SNKKEYVKYSFLLLVPFMFTMAFRFLFMLTLFTIALRFLLTTTLVTIAFRFLFATACMTIPASTSSEH